MEWGTVRPHPGVERGIVQYAGRLVIGPSLQWTQDGRDRHIGLGLEGHGHRDEVPVLRAAGVLDVDEGEGHGVRFNRNPVTDCCRHNPARLSRKPTLPGQKARQDVGFQAVDGKVHLAGSHILDANTSRFDQGDVAIRIDDAWKTELGTRDRRLVEALTFPLLVRYGYAGA